MIERLVNADFNRRPPHDAVGFKQWVHTTISARDISVVANFSAMPSPQLTTLVYAGRVEGSVRRYSPDACRAPYGRSALRFGRDRCEETDGGFALAITEESLELVVDVHLTPLAAPSTLHNIRVGGGGTFHWCVIPRLVADGTIEHRGRVHTIDSAPAYRDRNWGTFKFGAATWDWGYVLPDDPACPHSVVFARMMDATRTRVLEQDVLVWAGDLLLGAFRDHEVELTARGALRGPFPTVPAGLALCRSGHASDVPREVTVRGRSAHRNVVVELVEVQTARVVVPDDSGLGTTAIFESLGRANVSGCIDGVDVTMTGHSFLESVHA